jgi:hypothetical protein
MIGSDDEVLEYIFQTGHVTRMTRREIAIMQEATAVFEASRARRLRRVEARINLIKRLSPERRDAYFAAAERHELNDRVKRWEDDQKRAAAHKRKNAQTQLRRTYDIAVEAALEITRARKPKWIGTMV